MLKSTWTDKKDIIDDIVAEDINSVAHSAIESEENIVSLLSRMTNSERSIDELEQSISELKTQMGNVSTELDNIILLEEKFCM